MPALSLPALLLAASALVSPDDASGSYPCLSDEQVRAYDLDDDGVLQPNELRAAFLALAIRMEDELVADIDSNDDGAVQTSEMEAWIVAIPYAEGVVASAKRSSAWSDFLAKFDANGDGSVGPTEARRAYEYTKTLAEEKFQAADANGDGKLDDSEIRTARVCIESKSGEASALGPWDRTVTQQLVDFQSRMAAGPSRLFEAARGATSDVFDLATYGSDAQRRAALGVLQSHQSRGPAGKFGPGPSPADRNAALLEDAAALDAQMHANPRFARASKPTLSCGGPSPLPRRPRSAR